MDATFETVSAVLRKGQRWRAGMGSPLDGANPDRSASECEFDGHTRVIARRTLLPSRVDVGLRGTCLALLLIAFGGNDGRVCAQIGPPVGSVVLSSVDDCLALSRMISEPAAQKYLRAGLASGPAFAEFRKRTTTAGVPQYESRIGFAPPGTLGVLCHVAMSGWARGSTPGSGVYSWLEVGALVPDGIVIEDLLSLELTTSVLAGPPPSLATAFASGYWISRIRASAGSPDPAVRELRITLRSSSSTADLLLRYRWTGATFIPMQQL